EAALHCPIGTKELHCLSEGKQKVVILASDHTRPVPSKVIMPRLLREIRKGNPEAKITILIATGCHRGTTESELRAKFGDEIVAKEHIVVHDCDESEMVELGLLPSGGALWVNALAAKADLLIAEGFIEPHFFAGFSGGRKSVLPGIADRKTVLYNHNGCFIDSPYARTGILENNPIHKDMIFAAKEIGLDFICNVVLDEDKQIIHAVAGDCEMAHRAGCAFLKERCQVRAKPADLVVTSNGGYPLDQNIYQAVKGMTAAEALVRKDGVIIMAADCEDGHGGESFFKTFQVEKDLNRMMERFVSTNATDTLVDQWQSQILVRVLRHARVIFVSRAPDDMVENFQLIPAHSLEEALETAYQILGTEKPETIVIPDGVSVIAYSDG
ncbi:MAG: nickel-dependent lactate racemase, partial [bacterium]|nr:nickel-dependent lactate racemase [bacterium]